VTLAREYDNMRINIWVRGKFTNGLKYSKLVCWLVGWLVGWMFLMMCILGGHRLQRVLRLRSSSISVSETTEESELIKLHLKWSSIKERSYAKLFEGPAENILFWWNGETCGPLEQRDYV